MLVTFSVAVTEHDETIDQHVEQLDSISGDEPCDVLEYDDADIGDHISLTSGATSEISDFSHSSLEFDSDDDDTFSDSVSDADNENFNITTTGMTLADPEVQAVKLLSCFLRNNLSASTCKDILSTLRSMFPDSTAVQRLSYENIWKFVDDTNFRERHYCVDCDVVFPLDPDVFTCSTDSCGGLRYKGSEGVQMKKGRQARQSFVLADMAKQISSLLKSPGV